MGMICKLLTFSVVLLVISCSVPNKSAIKADFLKEHPDAEVIAVFAGEGDSSNVYMHIQYKLLNGAEIYEDVLLYQKLGDGLWKKTGRSASGD
jgi:hypothetical protein